MIRYIATGRWLGVVENLLGFSGYARTAVRMATAGYDIDEIQERTKPWGKKKLYTLLYRASTKREGGDYTNAGVHSMDNRVLREVERSIGNLKPAPAQRALAARRIQLREERSQIGYHERKAERARTVCEGPNCTGSAGRWMAGPGKHGSACDVY